MLQAVERDRAHEGYIALRKQTERLQNAARTAARKAQLAALSVQHQMMSSRVNGTTTTTSSSSSGSSSSSSSSSKTSTKMGKEAFDAAADLSWIALGGNDGKNEGRKRGEVEEVEKKLPL